MEKKEAKLCEFIKVPDPKGSKRGTNNLYLPEIRKKIGKYAQENKVAF